MAKQVEEQSATPQDDAALFRAARENAQLRKECERWRRQYHQATAEMDAMQARADYLSIINRDFIEAQNLKPLKGSGESTAILVLSDWHWEEKVDPKTINGRNAYDPKIAAKRAQNTWQRAAMLIDLVRGFTKIDTIVIAVLGDLITGYIHEELVESNWLSPTEACLEVQDQLVTGISFLKKEVKPKNIIIPTCYGNHGRTTKKPRISTGYANSYEWMMYQQLAWHYEKADPSVRWQVGRGYHNFLDVQGHRVRFHHGDSIRYEGGVGGITIPVNKAIAGWNKAERADLDIFGHYHQSKEDAWWVSNGSMIGYNAYSVRIKAEYETPSQSLVVVSRKRGKIASLRVFCE